MAIAAPTSLASVNSNTATQSSWATGAITFPTTGQAVLGLLVFSTSGTATAETFTVVDNAATPNTWTVVAAADNTGTEGHHTCVAYFRYPSAGAGTTVTVTISWGTATNERFGWCGYTTGHDTVTPNDQVGTLLGTTVQTSSTITTAGNLAANGELGVYVFSVSTNSTGPTGQPPTGWTAIGPGTTVGNPTDATRTRVGAFGYQVVAAGSGATLSAGAFTHTASSVGRPTGSIATFRAAAAAVVPPVKPQIVSQAVQRSYQW